MHTNIHLLPLSQYLIPVHQINAILVQHDTTRLHATGEHKNACTLSAVLALKVNGQGQM